MYPEQQITDTFESISMQNSQLNSVREVAKRAYVYTGYCRQNNYIQCLGSGTKPSLHNRLGQGSKQGRNASVTQVTCGGANE